MRSRPLIAALAATIISSCSSHSTPSVVPAPNSPLVQPHAASPGWTSFDIGGEAYNMALGHDGFMYATVNGRAITKIDPATYQLTFIPLRGSQAYTLTPNPDGNMYTTELFASSSALVRIAPDGSTTEITLPGTDTIGSIVTGSDQRIWMLRQDRSDNFQYLAVTTTHGHYVAFPTKVSAGVLVRGPDNNLWAHGSGGYVRFSIVDGSPTQFPSTAFGLVEGGDGRFWGYGGKKTIASFDPMSQQTSSYSVRPRLNMLGSAFVTKNLRWVEQTYLYSFNITKGRIVKRIPTPWPLSEGAGVSFAGPNHQLWVMGLNPGTVVYVYQF